MSVTPDELVSRLLRVHAAIGKAMAPDMSQFRARVTKFSSPDRQGIRVDFRGDWSDADLENYAWSAIHNVATLFNYLMEWAGGNEPLQARIKDIHEASNPLQALRSLDNKEKHPKIRNAGSDENLGLTELARVAQLNSGPGRRASLMVNADGSVKATDNVAVVISASVVNKRTGEKVGELGTILADGVATWEQFMREIGLLK